MSPDRYTGPKLPGVLLDKVQSGDISKNKRDVLRKDRRKAERQAKRQPSRPQQFNAGARRLARSVVDARKDRLQEDGRTETALPARRTPVKNAKPVKSILKRKAASPEPEQEDATISLEESDDEFVEEDAAEESEEEISQPVVSRSTKRKLEEDDAEIAALEKRLGIKGKKSKALQEDGLDWLAGGSGGESEDEDAVGPEDVDWLKNKRRKASAIATVIEAEDDGEEASASGSDDDMDDEMDDFEAFESEGEAQSVPASQKAKKENPYVAPGTTKGISDPTTKYIPPSLRKPASSDEEMLRHLHRQVQGKVNKVSESNMISILREVEDIYRDNARQHVTSTLIDILISLTTADVAHPDTVLITNAAFAAAIYKVIGTDFGAQLLERIVERFNHFAGQSIGERKQPLNLLAFLSYLYNFQVVGCALLFDYVRLLLGELTGDNTEMLLRIMRISGQQLRQDDPSALKDIVMLLQRLVAQTGEENLSVRTKFMIETINNLKNNRVKTGLAASAITAEHTTRMKRTIGTLNARAKATEPLRITLADINDTSKKGKWWLVGASYHDPARLASTTSRTSTPASKHDDSDTGYESAIPGSVNLTKLAKRSGMNTDVRRAIFIALLSAADAKDAHVRLTKLHLKNKQQLEIPRVLITCVGGEETYNPYYALVARRLCAGSSGRALRKGLGFAVWRFWQEIEREEGEGGDEEEEGEVVSVRKVVNLGKFSAALVAAGSLSLALLRKLDLPYLPAKQSLFLEVFVTSVFFQLHRSCRKNRVETDASTTMTTGDIDADTDISFEAAILRIFTCAGAPSAMLQGLQYFIRTTVESSELARTKKEKRALGTGCRVAGEALQEAEKRAEMGWEVGEGSEDESGG